LDYSDVGNLFPHDCVVDDMMVDFDKINRECFYGRSFGFQVIIIVAQILAYYYCFIMGIRDFVEKIFFLN